ncbi:MAG TPA: hypothetical protein VHL58_00430 [Thermoanaerobaculia bacterium]|nr:hypothetical protein [Thermoanaerobaculia bacterium]
MAQLLLFSTLITIAGLISSAIQGFTLHSRAAVGTHIVIALGTVIIGLFSQSMTMFFFIGTGKEIKDKAKGSGDEADVVGRTKSFKSRVFPAAFYSMMVIMATFILGGGVHRAMIVHQVGSMSWIAYIWIHRFMTIASIAIFAWAYVVEIKAMEENNRLMERFLTEQG